MGHRPDVYVRPDQWDKKSRQVNHHPNALAYNSLINRKMSENRQSRRLCSDAYRNCAFKNLRAKAIPNKTVNAIFGLPAAQELIYR